MAEWDDEDVFDEEEEDENETPLQSNTPSKTKSPSKSKKKATPWIEKIVKDFNKEHLAQASDLIRKIFLLQAPEVIITDPEKEIHLLTLPHPKRSSRSHYIFFPEHCDVILEISRCIYPPACWFIGDSVESNGSLYLCTRIDPLFLVLPLLKSTQEKGGRFMEWKELLMESPCVHFRKLVGLIERVDLSLIADIKKVDDDAFLKYSEEKALKFLRAKLFNTITALLNGSKDLIKGSAQSSSLRTTSKESVTKQDVLNAALGYLSEYISEDLIKKLSEDVGMSDFGPKKFSALDQLKSPQKKPAPFEAEEDDVALKKKKVETPKREKSKLEKANIDTTGMKSLFGYFKKGK